MTVQADYNIQTYEGNGETKTFTVPFKFFDKEIAVYKGKTFNTYQKGEDYTVKNNGNGGDVIFKSAPQTGDLITVVRSVPLNQLVTFIEGEDFPASDYEYSLDRIIMALQEMWADLKKVAIPPAAVSMEDFINNYYNKQEIDEKFNNIDLSDYYSKEEIDEKKSLCVDISFSPEIWGDRTDYTGDFPKEASRGYGVGERTFSNVMVTFNEADAMSGNFSPVCDWRLANNTASITIYAKQIPSETVVATLTFIY